MLRIGLVGIGDAARHHGRSLVALAADGACSWTALVARDQQREAKFRADVAAPSQVSQYPSLAALLDAKVCDAVIVATPDALHAEQVAHAAHNGVHVLVEKPLALSRVDGARAVDAARAAGTHVQVGYHLRHHQAHQLMLSNLAELVGTVRSVFVRWAWPDPATLGWRAKGDGARYWSLSALGTHGVDLALMFGGSPVSADTARVAAVLEPADGIDRAAELSFTLSGGALAHVSVSILHRAVSRLVVTGDKGELEAIGTLGARGDGELFHRPTRGPARPMAFAAESPYLHQLKAFVARVSAGFVDDGSLLSNLAILDCARPF